MTPWESGDRCCRLPDHSYRPCRFPRLRQRPGRIFFLVFSHLYLRYCGDILISSESNAPIWYSLIWPDTPNQTDTPLTPATPLWSGRCALYQILRLNFNVDEVNLTTMRLFQQFQCSKVIPFKKKIHLPAVVNE